MTISFKTLLEHYRNPPSTLENYRLLLEPIKEEFLENIADLHTILTETLDDEALSSLKKTKEIAAEKFRSLKSLQEELRSQKGSLDKMRRQIQELKIHLAALQQAAKDNKGSVPPNTETLFRIGSATSHYLAKHP